MRKILNKRKVSEHLFIRKNFFCPLRSVKDNKKSTHTVYIYISVCVCVFFMCVSKCMSGCLVYHHEIWTTLVCILEASTIYF